MNPLVSAVIVNYNGEKIIETAIKTLKKQSYNPIEIMVVDNNSNDSSCKIIKKYKNVKLIKNRENLGYTGINSCIKLCKGKLIFFTNNDVSLNKDCIKKLVETLQNDDEIGIASPKIVNYFDKSLKSCGTWVSRAFYNGHFTCSKDSRKIIPYNGVALIRKSIIDKFGYVFDNDYFIYAEDLDLGLRARLIGYKAMHVPEAVLYHMHGYTMKNKQKFNTTYLMERNLLATFVKILLVKNILLFVPYVLIMRLIAILRDLLTLNALSIFARLAAILNVVINIPYIFKKRMAIQKLRKKDDSFLLEVFSEKYMFSKESIAV